jgi:signal transduction histidine kinase
VLFEAKPDLEVVSVSDGVADLFGVNSSEAIRQPLFLHQRVAVEDRELFHEKLAQLETLGAVSFVHRFIATSGLPIWVTHSLRKIDRYGEPLIRGCLVPIGRTSRLLTLDQEVVSRFIHKLGNHFQLLTLIVSSLKSTMPASRDSEVLEETLSKAIELTRVLSDCNQVPTWVSEVHLLEVLKTAAESRANEFAAAGVRYRVELQDIPDEVIVLSAPYLLETALGHLLQNAFEATGKGGTVEFSGCVEFNGSHGVARLYVKDSGSGIPVREQTKAMTPFFSTKKGRDGLGLTVASRFVEMHGGTLRIDSRDGEGTKVAVFLPVERGREPFCA